jgi:RNA polymerase sigma-70 factor (ECF subfamily)
MTDNAHQDQAAVAAVRGGDVERYRELVERHERRVYAVAWSRLGDAALAEDAAQEAFIVAYRRLWLLGDGAKFAGWVNAIVRRVAINFGVRHRRELNRCERWALENLEFSPAEETDPPCAPETLRQTLAELPAAHRECLVLFYLEGKNGAEAAAALGISESALRVRLHRARAAMRERLEERLAESLEQLRPARPISAAVMGTILTSSPAKLVGGGVGAKILLSSFWSLILLIGILPSMAFSWFIARREQRNFRDAAGFRPQLHRQFFRSFVWGFPLIFVGFALLNYSAVAAWGINGGQLAVVCFLGIIRAISARSLTVNRNAFCDDAFEFLRIDHRSGFQRRQTAQICFAAMRDDVSIPAQQNTRAILADGRQEYRGHVGQELSSDRRQPQRQSGRFPTKVVNEEMRAEETRKSFYRRFIKTIYRRRSVLVIGKFQQAVRGAQK